MTFTQKAILSTYAAIIAIWPVRMLVLAWAFRQLDYLNPRSPRWSVAGPPRVAAIIPAKDEESTIADCLATVQRQSHPSLEILVVDDRSEDQTARIVEEMARLDPRIKLVSIEQLPAGWTGKTHALHVAASKTTAEWLWFIDADTRHEPDSLSIVLEYARTKGAQMASLLPELRCETFWESVVQPLAGIVLIQSYPLFWANDPRRKLAFANGQYILIQREAYDRVGGHEAVRDKFVEDIHLARLVKRAGLSSRTAIAHGLGSTRMYTSLPQIVRGWSRILYDALDRNPFKLLLQGLDPLIFSQSAHVVLGVAIAMLILGQPPRHFWLTLGGMSVLHHILAYATLRPLYRQSVPTTRHVAWYPLAGLVLDLILFRAIKMCFTGNVSWRGTAYRGADTPSLSS